MSHEVFISHVEEDAGLALELAAKLEVGGFHTWYYERDSLPGPHYLLQVEAAIDRAKVVIVLISPHALSSVQVTGEILRASQGAKCFLPLLLGISHAKFQQRQPVWRQAMAASTALVIPASGLALVIERIIAGVQALLSDACATGSEVVNAIGSPPKALPKDKKSRLRIDLGVLLWCALGASAICAIAGICFEVARDHSAFISDPSPAPVQVIPITRPTTD